MNLKQLIVFFSVSAAFFLFILIYNVSAQDMSANPAMHTDNVYAKTSVALSDNFKLKTDHELKPKYTPRQKPAGAPKAIKNKNETSALYAKGYKKKK